jgi:putative PIN family toxin of toxin-antitoxin system
MKVVFDANVLLSAFLTRSGVAQQVFIRAIETHQVLSSEYILREVSKTLSGKLKIPVPEVASFMSYARSRMAIIDLPENSPSICFEDPKDIPILHLLEVSGAHYFVTGDKKVLELKKYKRTLILSLREALELL